MLIHVDTNELEQQCGNCGTRRRIPLASLIAGVEHGEPARPMTPNIIALPQCPACAAREFLNRVVMPPGTRSATGHGPAVNAVHATLVAAGQVAPTLREYFAEERFITQQAELPWTYAGDLPVVHYQPDPFADFVRRSARSPS